MYRRAIAADPANGLILREFEAYCDAYDRYVAALMEKS
jgi:hypothetical protein